MVVKQHFRDNYLGKGRIIINYDTVMTIMLTTNCVFVVDLKEFSKSILVGILH